MSLHPSGILVWPEESLAIVSDLHLEKGSYFATRGQLLPPYDSAKTLEKLQHTLEDFECKHLLFLGDTFHDVGGYERLNVSTKSTFDYLLHNYHFIWISGNHENGFAPKGIKSREEFTIKGITFRHEAQKGAKHEISGHYHPKACLKARGQKVSRPCFIKSDTRIIMPAFGTYTGGLDVKDDAIKVLFQDHRIKLYLLGNKKIYQVFEGCL